MASKVMNIVNSLVEERKTMKEQNYIWEGEEMGWCYVVKYEANKFGARVELNNGSIVNTMDCSGDYLRSYNYWKNLNKEEEEVILIKCDFCDNQEDPDEMISLNSGLACPHCRYIEEDGEFE
jgi:hypothetical protein